MSLNLVLTPGAGQLLISRHPEISKSLLKIIVKIADHIRHSPDLGVGLSVRATDEACICPKHPLMEKDQAAMLSEVLKSSFCGRFSGRWDDVTSDAGAAWAIIRKILKDERKLK